LRAALAFALVALLPALGSAQDREYRVREGDTCGSIARRVYGDSRRYDRIHAANPQLGPMPHHLEPGTRLVLPAAGERASDATVTAVRRQVASQPPRVAAWSRARVGQELGQGWRVNTEARSSAELTFRASSVVAIRERTLVIVYGEGVRPAEESSARAVVREGSMLSRLSALSGGEPLEVETPSARATLRTGEASVDVDAEGTTRVAVHEGQAASVRGASGRALEVPAGMGTKVRPGRAPSRLRRLPSPPRWREDAPRRFLAVGEHGATVRAAWSPSPDASRYRVEVARRADGRDLIFATEVGAEVRELELRRMPAGTYFIRLATIDDDRFEGRPGRGIEVTVIGSEVLSPGSEPAVAPARDPLAAGLADLDSGLADLDFESLPDAPPELLRHSRLVPEGGVACALAEGAAVPSLALVEPGDFTLTCSGGEEPIAPVSVRVSAAQAHVYADDADRPARLARGASGVVRVAMEPGELRGLTLAGGPGIEVTSVEPHPRGGLRAALFVSAGAPEASSLRVLASDGTELAVAALGTEEGAPDAATEADAEPVYRPRALHEGLGLASFASRVGLRDERRRGSGMHLAATGQSAADGDPDALVRLSAGLRASLLEERLRLELAVPLDVVGSTTRTAQRGSRDVYAAASSLLVDDRDLGLGLAAELGVWAPTAGVQGLDRGRLQVAADASLRLLDERIAIRTRQAGLFDLTDGGSLLWASAYGFDVWIAGPLSAGVELSLVMGREDARDWIAGGAGAGIALDFHPIVISIAGRYGFGADATLGRGVVSAAVRGSFDP